MEIRAVIALLMAAMTVHCSMFQDCEEIYTNISSLSGVYTIVLSLQPVAVYCDMDTDGGRWTVIQRRVDGSVNFYRPWELYKTGFGSSSGEYWMGLENMHVLTKDRSFELRVDMEDFLGNKVFAQYSSFSVGSVTDGYVLNVAGFKDGGAGDSLSGHNGFKFSTFDKDQDMWSNNCASHFYGAFWYGACHTANLNGAYLWGDTAHFATSINWHSWKGHHYSLKAVAMKIRPVPLPV